MRDFDGRGRVAVVALAVAAASCSVNTVVAVDPYPCSDAGPGACTSGLFDGLIGFWRLRDGSGSVTALDSSGFGNTGTMVDLDPVTAWVSGGPEGTALSVQGKGYVNVAPSASIDSITNQLTLVASVYLEETVTDHATAISRQIGDGLNQLYYLSVDANQKALLIIDAPDGFILVESPDPVSQNSWLRLAGTWDGKDAHLYVDGAEVGSGALSSGPFEAETTPLVIAGNGNNMAVTELVPGRLDDVMLYRRALTSDEIAQLANGALVSGAAPSDAGGQ